MKTTRFEEGQLSRKDFYDILANLPKLPEGAVIAQPYSAENPIAIDSKTQAYYRLVNNEWVMDD